MICLPTDNFPINKSFTFHQIIFLGLRGFGYSIWIHSIVRRCIPSGSVYFCLSLFFSFVLSPIPSTLLYLSLSLLFFVSLSSLSFSFFLSIFNLSLFYFILLFSLQHFIPTLLIFNLSLSLSIYINLSLSAFLHSSLFLYFSLLLNFTYSTHIGVRIIIYPNSYRWLEIVSGTQKTPT